MKVKFFLVFVLSIISVSVAYFTIIKVREFTAIENSRAKLPSFRFENLNGNLYSRDSLVKKQWTIVIHFHPDCDFCHNQIQLLNKKIDHLKNTNLVLVSAADQSITKKFASQYKLNKKIKVSTYDNDDFFKYFGTHLLPATLIYDPFNELKTVFKGEVDIETLIKSVK